MTLKIVKGGKSKNSEISSGSSDKGLFIIEATNVNNEVGYIADVKNKISVSAKLIPQVIRYNSYKEAKRQINHIESNIQGLKLKVIGQKRIEEILANQKDLDMVVPLKEVTDTYIVSIFDINTKETIGYLSYNPATSDYSMKHNKDQVAFWESKNDVDQFIEGAKDLITSHPNLKLRPEKA